MAGRSTQKSRASAEVAVLPIPGALQEHHLGSSSGPLSKAMAQWRESRHVPPVILLTGPAGIGKSALAHHLAQWMLCDQTGFSSSASGAEQDDLTGSLFGDLPASAPAVSGSESSSEKLPCGECLSCQKALSGSWVDFTDISAGEDSGSTSLKIDQFRDLKTSMGRGAFDGPFRITFIRDAERMTPQAANSLLKILEEPPPGWIFILSAGDSSLLLPTLVSRCQTFRLRPLSKQSLLQLLEENRVPPARRELCATLAHGSLSQALALSTDEVWERREQVLAFLSETRNRPQNLNTLVEWAAQDPKSFQLLLDLLETSTATLLTYAAASGRGQPLERGLAQHASELVQKLGSMESAGSFWLNQAEQIFAARRSASAPLNRKLLVQDLLFSWIPR